MSEVGFDFSTAGRIVFGTGRASELASLAGQRGSRVLVCTGGDPSRHSELVGSLAMPVTLLSVSGEPTVELVRQGAAVARQADTDLVVAIGGGSAIDFGKAVAMLVGNGGDPLDYMEVIGAGRLIERASVPFIALPTTAGTGAEVTANATLASPEHALKASLRSPFMLPSVALVDPLLTLTSPPSVVASSGLDALTQCLEPYVSVKATPLTDGLAREGLRRARAGLRRSYADGGDLPARTDMSLCSLIGGLCLANAKLGAVHGLAGVIGGMVAVPHGAACAALLVATIEANVRALRAREPQSPALGRYQQAAELLTGRGGAEIEDGIAWIAQTVGELGIKGLAHYGLRPGQTDEIVAKAAGANSTKGNPIELRADELGAVVTASM